jgi:hypothetical protein
VGRKGEGREVGGERERERVVVCAGASRRARILGACVCASCGVPLHLNPIQFRNKRRAEIDCGPVARVCCA